ncbi:MAG: methyl-CpG-binding protein [Oceanospirillaceae bacterium]|nr:methyl-CpG-binding protein [Oceanospirillaceae bacterium]
MTSHYTSNCTWKNQGGKKGNGKGKGKGKQGVRKDNDKQKNKGQGKGKGKGGKKNQGFKGGRGTDPWA